MQPSRRQVSQIPAAVRWPVREAGSGDAVAPGRAGRSRAGTVIVGPAGEAVESAALRDERCEVRRSDDGAGTKGVVGTAG